MPDVGGPEEVATSLVILVGAVVVAVVLVPLLLFGIELILLGFLVGAAILGRGVLGRPWVVQARRTSDTAPALTWRVIGWRRSGRLIDEVARALAAGLEPSPSEDAELVGADAR
jgi:hypothetical protein